MTPRATGDDDPQAKADTGRCLRGNGVGGSARAAASQAAMVATLRLSRDNRLCGGSSRGIWEPHGTVRDPVVSVHVPDRLPTPGAPNPLPKPSAVWLVCLLQHRAVGPTNQGRVPPP